jgi:alpha-L-arabinofuranosidase
MAARWTTPASSTPTYKAMKMYRNYDGNRSTFGDTSVAATTANPDTVAAFAAQRSADSALTVMVINKDLSASTPATINLAGFQPGGTAQVWQLTAANTINRLPDIGVGGASLGLSLPPQSITLLVVAGSSSSLRAPTNLRITR